MNDVDKIHQQHSVLTSFDPRVRHYVWLLLIRLLSLRFLERNQSIWTKNIGIETQLSAAIAYLVVMCDQIPMKAASMMILADWTNEIFLSEATKIAQASMLNEQLIEM